MVAQPGGAPAEVVRQLRPSVAEVRGLELAREHHKYEERLSELSALSYPSDEEQLEEITLKKKKLALKDQMYSMMLQYQKTQSFESLKLRRSFSELKESKGT